MLGMGEYVASSPASVKLHMPTSCIKGRRLVLQNSCFGARQRKYRYESYKVSQSSTWRSLHLSVNGASCLKLSSRPKETSSTWRSLHISVNGAPCLKLNSRPKETSLACSWLGSLVSSDSAAAMKWAPVADQLLLMASIFLTYMAGVIPGQKSYISSQENISADQVDSEHITSSGSSMRNDEQINPKYAWDTVKAKILDAQDVMDHTRKLGKGANESDQQNVKRPLSLYAVAEGPRFRLLLAAFQQLQNEVNGSLGNSARVTKEDWLELFDEVILKSCWPICIAWLGKELLLEKNNIDKVLVSMMFEKVKGNDTVLQTIRKSGKEDLYAELLAFLTLGSPREGGCYDQSLFISHGVSILEDLVITLADGIASIYLELISVDSNLSTEMNSLGLFLCNLSTRALQRLRNEVALNMWLHQNMEVVVSMYEDRFDLWTLQSQFIEGPSKGQTENYSWWAKFVMAKSDNVPTPLRYVAIGRFSMRVKRTKELRALIGWRYYFSLFLELSDIGMPFVRVVFDKISSAISFFLVTLIGRSLGLIYTGIRQSLRWK